MQNNLSYNLFAADNSSMKGYLLMHYIERIIPMAKKFTRKQQEKYTKILDNKQLLLSYRIVLTRLNSEDEQSIWEYNMIEKELLNRMY